jgi:hypothetical protein
MAAQGRTLRRATPATCVRTTTAGLPSPIDLVQRWMACQSYHPLLFGRPGDAPKWRPGTLSVAVARALQAVSRGPPAGHYLGVAQPPYRFPHGGNTPWDSDRGAEGTFRLGFRQR